MKLNSSLRNSLASIALAAVAGCGGGGFSAPATVQAQAQTRPALTANVRGAKAFERGLYVSVGSEILGYKLRNRHNGPPFCRVGGSYADVAVDLRGNLLALNGLMPQLTVYRGPDLCGPQVGTIGDPYGQPADAASRDALHGKIAVANIFNTSGAGSISLCTLAGGCTVNLTNANMYEVVGVALDRHGNCWAAAANSSGTATLTYFAGCSGAGEPSTGFVNAYYGSLDIDGGGHLVAISGFDSKLYVYSGCRPACKLAGGPFQLHGEAVSGHLNEDSTRFATADFQYNQIDVYRYTPAALKYEYSFNDGLSGSEISASVAYSPHSKEQTSGPSTPAGARVAPQTDTTVAVNPIAGKTFKRGLYVSVNSAILGYKSRNRHNGPPVCTIAGTKYAGGIAADLDGNLLASDFDSKRVIVYRGPALCGPKAGRFSDRYGRPTYAASRDALGGKIIVATVLDTSTSESIAICTLAGGCTANLENPNMGEIAGVALDRHGNCWADATSSTGNATLTFFAGCTGAGETSTGFMNAYYGALDIDSAGHLIALSAFDSKLYVYSGCRPACKLVGGPFTLNGEAVFGQLNEDSTNFATADFEHAQVDVYRYTPTALTYEYSFNNGQGQSTPSGGLAYSPHSRE
ncbi:MAG: hypothetical protein JO104_02705 [Candidatus Eremiobacteraeota bacterium]|nr:hypothetical protein [Candidatus Eremiobacteraeota bacterium]